MAKNIYEIRDEVLQIEAAAKKRQRFVRVGRYPAGFLFAALTAPLFYGFTYVMDSADPTELEALLRVPYLSKYWSFVEGIFGGGWSAFIGAAAIAAIVPILWLIIAALMVSPTKTKASATKGETELEITRDTASHISKAETAYYSDGGVLLITSLLCIIGNIAAIVMTMLKTQADEKATVGNIIGIILVSVFILAGTLIADCILSIPMSIFSHLVYKKRKIKEYSEIVRDKIISYENAEKAKKAEEKKQKKLEKEKAKQKAEEEKLEKAKALYEKARDTENDELMEEAAELRHPEACLEMGKKHFYTLTTEALTNEERTELGKKVENYLEKALPLGVEPKFLLCGVRVYTDSHNKEEWEKLLAEIREIKKSGQLPENYSPLCDMLLTTVVETIDRLDAKIKEELERPKVVYVPARTDVASIRRKKGLTITGYTHWVTGEPLFINSVGQIVTEDGVFVPEHLRDGGE